MTDREFEKAVRDRLGTSLTPEISVALGVANDQLIQVANGRWPLTQDQLTYLSRRLNVKRRST